ncbi:hypothetical protein PQX77_018386 [Marasmius sp. AFHP31]|nr:hypothetical protein PQX77_018386 [Marasmius sp. AFHP31]
MLLLLAALSDQQLDPDSTTPTPSSSGDTRTAASIVWSCLSMVILCTWTSVRPNVPCVSRSGHEALVYWDDAKIFLVALIAPEFVVLWSIRQWFAARWMVKEYRKYKWTMTHAFFAQMGGFALYDSEGNFLFHLWDQKFCHRDQGGQDGYVAQLQKLRELHPHGDGQYQSPLEYCVANGLIIMTEDEIKNLGHTDFLAKTIAIFQTLYFITNCIARGDSGLATTELEFFTLGFAVLNLVSYLFWWHKPSRVRFPVRVMARLPHQMSSYSQNQGVPSAGIRSAFSNRIRDDYGGGDKDSESLRRRILWAVGRKVGGVMNPGSSPHFERGNILLTGYSKVGNNLTFVPMLFVAAILGVIHCIPIMLNYHGFPGHTQDHRLWTIFALLTTVLPLEPLILATVGIVIVKFPDNWASKLVKTCLVALAVLSLPLYVIARLALMVLAAKQLTDLPPSALQQVEWTTFIPHFGV